MRDTRQQFQSFKRALLKEHGINELICARCGRYSKSTHLHHITEIAFGGANAPENLIPLCGDCHREWDYYDGVVPFEAFLKTPTLQQIAFSWGKGYPITVDTAKMIKTASFCHHALTWDSEIYDTALHSLKYIDELERQNALFGQYRYCDNWRLDLGVDESERMCTMVEQLGVKI